MYPASTLAMDMATHWHNDGADQLRFDYPLNEASLVFDVGGYKGDWAYGIAEKFNPYIYIFEPIPQFYSEIVKRFEHNPKTTCFNFGFLDRRGPRNISVNNDRSSLYVGKNRILAVSLEDIGNFLTRRKIEHVDLVKINIEGAEYPLLRHMVNTGLMPIFQNILIQFHIFYPDAMKIRQEIRASLKSTHLLTFDYPFVWESWRKRDS